MGGTKLTLATVMMFLVFFSLLVLLEGFSVPDSSVAGVFEKYDKIVYTMKPVDLGDKYVEPEPPMATKPERIAMTMWQELVGSGRGPVFKGVFMQRLDDGELHHFTVFSEGIEVRLEKVPTPSSGEPTVNASIVFREAIVVYKADDKLVEDYLTGSLDLNLGETPRARVVDGVRLVPMGELAISALVSLDPTTGALYTREGGEKWLGAWPYMIPNPNDGIVVYLVKPAVFEDEGYKGLVNILLVENGTGRPAFSIFNPHKNSDAPKAMRQASLHFKDATLMPARPETPVFDYDFIIGGSRYKVNVIDVYEYHYNSEGLLVSAYPSLLEKAGLPEGFKAFQEVSNLLLPVAVLDKFRYATVTPFSRTALLALDIAYIGEPN